MTMQMIAMLPFRERYQGESDTSFIVNGEEIVVTRGGEEVRVNLKDPYASMFHQPHMSIEMDCGNVSPYGFLKSLTIRPPLLYGDRCLNLAEIVWIYAHRPESWDLKYRMVDAINAISDASDHLEKLLRMECPKFPMKAHQKLNVSVTRGERRGMMAGRPHKYLHGVFNLEYIIRIDNEDLKFDHKFFVPG